MVVIYCYTFLYFPPFVEFCPVALSWSQYVKVFDTVNVYINASMKLKRNMRYEAEILTNPPYQDSFSVDSNTLFRFNEYK